MYAQNIDLKRSLLRSPNLSLQYANFENGIVSYQLNAGLPPLFWGKNKKNFFTLNTSFSELQLAPTHLSERVNFKRISFIPIYRRQLENKWAFSTVLPFSFAQDEYSHLLETRGLALIGVASWTKNLNPAGSNYGVGLIFIKLAQRFFIVPNFSYQYVNPELNWAFRLGFPRIAIERIFNNFILGAFTSISFDTFLLDEKTPLSNNPQVTYINSEKTLTGFRLHFKGFHHVFIDLEAGLILNERLFLSNDKRDRISGTDFNRKGFESFFSNFILGYKF